MKDASFASFANADQAARDQTWQDGQVGASETLFQIPPDPLRAKKRLQEIGSGQTPSIWMLFVRPNGTISIS
jgi:hypothetical protein